MSIDWKNKTVLATDTDSLFSSPLVETLVNRGASALAAEREVTRPLYAMIAEVDMRAVVNAAHETLARVAVNHLDFM